MNEKQKRRANRKAKKIRHERRREDAKIEAEVQRVMRSYPLQMVRQPENPCGPCQACCESVGVHEIEKPMWTRCQHQCSTGCGIYEQRPDSCRGYYCLYQIGALTGGEEMRPDNLGVILDMRATSTDGNAISAWEIREGAADDPRVLDILRAIGNRFVVIVRRYKSSKRRIIGPAHLINGMRFEEFS